MTCVSETRGGDFCDCKNGFIEIGENDCLKCNKRCKLCEAHDLNICLTCNENRAKLPKCDCKE